MAEKLVKQFWITDCLDYHWWWGFLPWKNSHESATGMRFGLATAEFLPSLSLGSGPMLEWFPAWAERSWICHWDSPCHCEQVSRTELTAMNWLLVLVYKWVQMAGISSMNSLYWLRSLVNECMSGWNSHLVCFQNGWMNVSKELWW